MKDMVSDPWRSHRFLIRY